jgi:iron complex outermembrane receptor protein
MNGKYNNFLSYSIMTASAALLTIGTIAPAMAQSSTNDNRATIEEIVVTAQKRTESLQDVPVAITAFTGEALRRLGITDLKGMSERVPGMYIAQQKPGQAQFYVRGVGSNDDGPSSDQSIPVYIDEQYIPRTAGQVLDLFDLERVEVLRGPQGTLFGRNAAGGAVHLITKKAPETQEARVEASYGNLNYTSLQAYFGGPITGDWLGKVSVSSRKRDGYVTSVMGNFPDIAKIENLSNLKNKSFMNTNSDTIRAGLRYLPGNELEINLSGTYSTRDETGVIKHYRQGPAGNQFGGSGGFFFATDSALIPNYKNNFHKTIHDDPGETNIRTWMGSARIDYDLSWGATLTSLTTYQKTEFSADDNLATENMALLRLTTNELPGYTFIGNNPANEESSAFSQELRLSSSDDSRLQWVAGLYYLDEKVDRDETAGLGIVMSDGAGGLIPIVPVTRGGELQKAESTSFAAFGQGTYAVTDRLSLTAGIRFTRDDKNVDLVGTRGGLVVVDSYAGLASKSWSESTPKFALDFKVSEDVMVYALASKGFKSGGWQGLAPTYESALLPFDPETTWLYELGVKSEMLDNRLRVNVAVFSQDYEDMQISQSLVPEDAPPDITAVLFTNNAASSNIRGVELEFEAALTPNWLISGMYAYLDTSFSQFLVPAGFRLLSGAASIEDRVGNDLKRSPRSMANLVARYTHDMSNGGEISAQLAYRHIGENFGDVDNFSFGAIPEYDVLDGRVEYNVPESNWTLALWANNLTDEQYYVNVFPNIESGWGTPGPPRTFGITVNWEM